MLRIWQRSQVPLPHKIIEIYVMRLSWRFLEATLALPYLGAVATGGLDKHLAGMVEDSNLASFRGINNRL